MEKMSFENFYNVVIGRVEGIVEDNYFVDAVREVTVRKNNHTSYEGISIVCCDGCNPVLNVDELYEQYDGTNLDDILDDKIEKYINSAICTKPDPELLFNKDFVEENIVGQLINSDWNEDYLKSVPHRSVEDLSIIYRVIITTDIEGNTLSCTITNGLAKKLGYSEEDLYNMTMHNIENGVIIESFNNMLQMFISPEEVTPSNEWKIMTNKKGRFGASSIMCKEKMDQLQKTLGDLIIIPSSVHEVIIIPRDSIPVENLNGLIDIIQEVNTACVEDKDILSNHPYIYTTEGIKSYKEGE